MSTSQPRARGSVDVFRYLDYRRFLADVYTAQKQRGLSYRAKAEADGSFELTLDAQPTDIYELRAAESAQASPVYVARGTASVAGGSSGLSCKQREELALAHMSSVSQGASESSIANYCKSDADCVLASTGTICNDACSGVPVSRSGASEVEQARQGIETGICRSFQADGCNFIVFPCVAPAPSVLLCEESQCKLRPLKDPPTASDDKPGCVEPFARGMSDALSTRYWYSPDVKACLPRGYGGSGGNANRYDNVAACEAACKPASPVCLAPRVLVNVCLEGGPAGGCARFGSACAVPCSQDEECESDPIGRTCNSFCDATSPE